MGHLVKPELELQSTQKERICYAFWTQLQCSNENDICPIYIYLSREQCTTDSPTIFIKLKDKIVVVEFHSSTLIDSGIMCII